MAPTQNTSQSKNTSQSQFFWYSLMFLAVVVCILIPIGLVATFLYEGEVSKPVQEKPKKVQLIAEKKVNADYSKPDGFEKSPEKTAKDSQVKTEEEPKKTNTAPKAKISYNQNPKKFLEYVWDGSLCKDAEDSLDDLQIRWDFDGDGNWDTEYTKEKKIVHTYKDYGTYKISLQVIDKQGLTDIDTLTITNYVPEIKFSKHKNLGETPCADCHHPASTDAPCDHAEVNPVCLDCHRFQSKQ